MSDAGIAFWAAMGGGLLAGVSSMSTMWVSNRAAAKRDCERFEHEERMAANARRHEAEMAAEARRQERIEGAYLRVLGVVNAGWELMERDSPTKEPRDHEAVNARVESVFAELDAFASNEVREIFGRWRVPWGLFSIDVHNARVRAGSGSPDRHDLEVLEGHRAEARETAKELAAQVAAELRGDR